MDSARILSTRPLPGPAFAELSSVEVLQSGLTGGLKKERPGIVALIVAGDAVTENTLEFLPDLGLVAQYGVGFDNVDINACARRGICIVTTPGVLSAATADFTMTLILAAQRRLIECDAFVRSDRWNSESIATLEAREVSGSTLGVIGMGRIGTAVVRRARAFDMKVLYTQRRRLSPKEEGALGVSFENLDEMLPKVDILTVHCPLTSETRGLLDRRRLSLLKDCACVVNTARGAIVDERALVAEVTAGRLRVALDVYTFEPSVPEGLRSASGATLAPHVASLTTTTRHAMTRLVVDNVKAFVAGKPLLTPIVLETKA
jgi:glyoxylate reductase